MTDTLHPNVHDTDCDWCGRHIAKDEPVAYMAGELACKECLETLKP